MLDIEKDGKRIWKFYQRHCTIKHKTLTGIWTGTLMKILSKALYGKAQGFDWHLVTNNVLKGSAQSPCLKDVPVSYFDTR